MADFSRDDKEKDKYRSLDDLIQEEKKSYHKNDDRHRDNRRNRDRDRRRSNSNNKEHGNGSYKVFVSNLSFDTTWKTLKDHMRKAGEVVRADVFMDDRGRSRGLGIVEYKSNSDATRAIKELHNSTLDGRVIFAREVGIIEKILALTDDEERGGGERGHDRSGNGGGDYSHKRNDRVERVRRSRSRSLSIQRKGQKDADSRDKGKKIFIGNLPYSVSKQQLKEAFKEFGDILSTEVQHDDRGKSKGYGIVIFSDWEAADEAIKQMDQAKFNDRTVTVRLDRNY
ncbi:single-stranded g-strand telomeric dna-binding protein [Stylonychia lemnae]|uniref:Single-stranded g-strand telomeric dna-binding protein n=1 Tax=Stylonychia lemnae TaxID=5949 RepID=A0A078AI18_STYLE|nr:single-stranded g-strand telomeric dna-binding protein [Stylonychia lemnae]|eukprot:CDW80438.1 single-stranded g-strand telomeric dna-binding protein [Stylonychia lemnae]